MNYGTLIPTVADLPTLAGRYRLTADELQTEMSVAVTRYELPPPWEFQGVEIWPLAIVDGWACRWLRRRHGVAQQDLAVALDVLQPTMARWERDMPTHIGDRIASVIEEIATTRAASGDAA